MRVVRRFLRNPDVGGLRSAMGYCGCATIADNAELPDRAGAGGDQLSGDHAAGAGGGEARPVDAVVEYRVSRGVQRGVCGVVNHEVEASGKLW